MKRERDPTAEEFEKLLAWLDSDGQVAGIKYETIHKRLIKIFVSRICIDAESLADEVMNRVAVRIEQVVQTYPGDPARCFQGFAENVYLEHKRDQHRFVDVDPPAAPAPPDNPQREREDQCLTRCMAELSPTDRELFSRYFQEEKRNKIDGRKKLAGELRLTANALRIKAHRIRKRLLVCMEACLEEVRRAETNRA